MNTNELTMGLDLGDRRHHVCVLNGSGEIIAEEVLPNTRECLRGYAVRYPGRRSASPGFAPLAAAPPRPGWRRAQQRQHPRRN